MGWEGGGRGGWVDCWGGGRRSGSGGCGRGGVDCLGGGRGVLVKQRREGGFGNDCGGRLGR